MKAVILVCLLVAIVRAQQAYRHCIYDDRGMCMSYCPEGTVSFSSGCGHEGLFTSRTCSDPVPRDVSQICDMSWCGCADRSLAWDDLQKKCVKLEDCARPTKTQRPYNYNYDNNVKT